MNRRSVVLFALAGAALLLVLFVSKSRLQRRPTPVASAPVEMKRNPWPKGSAGAAAMVEPPSTGRDLSDPEMFKEVLLSFPEETIPELKLLDDQAWATVARFVRDRGGALKAFQTLRNYAKVSFSRIASKALMDYERVHGRPPTTIADLRPFLPPAIDQTILDRYDLVKVGGGQSGLRIASVNLVEVKGVRSNYDSVIRFSKGDSIISNYGGYGSEIERGVNRYEVVHGPQTTFSVDVLRPFVEPSVPSALIAEHLDRYYWGTRTRPRR